MHIYRWDLDRTYLETEIHSTRGLLRAAVEQARDKRTVPGAATLVRGLQSHDPESRLFVLSGSPRQMKGVLREKLALDGVRVDHMVLKDNLRNLRKLRFRAIRDQVGYKLPELLDHRPGLPGGTTETLFGDDSELDAVIYAVYGALVAGRLEERDLLALLDREQVYPDAVARARRGLAKIARTEAVEDIFIRVDRGVPPGLYHPLGSNVQPVFSWWQAALRLFERGRLSAATVGEVAIACGLVDRPQVAAGFAQDAVRRGVVSASALLTAMKEGAPSAIAWAALIDAVANSVDGLSVPAPPAAPSSVPDYHGFLDALAQWG